MVCPENYDTFAPGVAVLGTGAALGLLGFYLWTREDSGTGTRLSVLPTQEGWSAALSGAF
jgi:hypothetical protein